MNSITPGTQSYGGSNLLTPDTGSIPTPKNCGECAYYRQNSCDLGKKRGCVPPESDACNRGRILGKIDPVVESVAGRARANWLGKRERTQTILTKLRAEGRHPTPYRLLSMRDAIEMQIRDFRAFSAYFHGGVSRTPATFVKFQRERARALGFTEFRVLIYNPESSVVIWAADYESALRLVFAYGRI